MLTIIIKCNAPSGMAIGIKEDLAMHLERYGDCKVVEISETEAEQMEIGEGNEQT